MGLQDVKIYAPDNGVIKQLKEDKYLMNSNYNYNKILNLFNNSDTFSFLDVIFDFNTMIEKGYNRRIFKTNITYNDDFAILLASYDGPSCNSYSTHYEKNAESFKFIIIGLILSVIIYYFKDLSLALGKLTEFRLYYQYGHLL